MNVIEWAETHWSLESGELIRLRPWQRAVLLAMFPEDGSPSPFETFLVSTIKKAGKTELNALATCYAALTFRAPETVFCLANDLEQAHERVFVRVVRALRAMGLERSRAALISANEVLLPETGTRIVALPADFAGAAGAVFGVSSWTELWAYRAEAHVRLWEEMTPIPNRRSLRIVDSYAGFEGDSPVLEPLWARALAGDKVSEDPPVYTAGKLWALIDEGEPAQARGWLGDPAAKEAYYSEQRASLRPGTYARLHENRWQSGEEAFVSAALWDAIVVAELRPLLPGERNDLRLSVGIDAATKDDCAAVVAVAKEGDRVRLVQHRIWRPRQGEPLDLEETVEAYVLWLARHFQVAAAVFDPMQMQRSAATLRKAGVKVEEFPQTVSNLTRAGQALYDLIRARSLAVYPDAELRQHALNAVAVETGRGWRLAKEKSSRKIDGVAALSFACVEALDPANAGCVWGISSRRTRAEREPDHLRDADTGELPPCAAELAAERARQPRQPRRPWRPRGR